MTTCTHKNAVGVRGGLVHPEEKLHNYEAAWCSDCGAFREAATFTKAEPWLDIGTDLSKLPDKPTEVKVKPAKKKAKKKRKK